MIFVTVGTHEQQFDRLVKSMDRLVADGAVDEPVFIQTGYCVYEPKSCEWKKFLPAFEMRSRMEAADVVVTHGGPSSFIEAMAAGKVPVVVPRRAELGEHVNDHQTDFVHEVAERQGGIVPVSDMIDLPAAIEEARRRTADGMSFESHNAKFCDELELLIERL
ncbi:glycosyltransferase [Gordonibacter massiliensis (ex Traore et al. 2017)]|uniref:glycosyltransferase n=1 Tax=Gordonibacter massiliensis (ex Traore et al. 2017) TaxID=1841863 RepID=UPI001C8B0AEB|nr:glycosyltransferase [Gordonibacter massiliensis (ex Traore et al. 2017)]MBX9033589.1 multidrug MFS transporter [Gordonibacter massiliensis (ex Traore et al. 2017)]